MSFWSPAVDPGDEEVTELTAHLSHALMLLAPVAVFVLLFALEWRRTAEDVVPAGLQLMALLSGAAGVVHGAVVGHHAHRSAVLGWFFALTCLVQVAQALALVLTPVRRVVVVGVLVDLSLVALWVWTRVVGVPMGVDGGQRQLVRPVDVACTLLEVGAVLAGLAWVYSATGGSLPSALSEKWVKSTVTNSPLPLKTSVPSPRVPSQETNSLRPSRESIRAASS